MTLGPDFKHQDKISKERSPVPRKHHDNMSEHELRRHLHFTHGVANQGGTVDTAKAAHSGAHTAGGKMRIPHTHKAKQ